MGDTYHSGDAVMPVMGDTYHSGDAVILGLIWCIGGLITAL